MRASPVNTYWYKKLIKHRDTETREKAQRKNYFSSVASLCLSCLCGKFPSTPQYMTSVGNNRKGTP